MGILLPYKTGKWAALVGLFFVVVLALGSQFETPMLFVGLSIVVSFLALVGYFYWKSVQSA